MSQIHIADQPILFAVVDDELDVGRCPNRLNRGKVYADNSGTRISVAHCVGGNTWKYQSVGLMTRQVAREKFGKRAYHPLPKYLW